jgi:energy-converting hydrogenase Eha subunit A
MASPLLPIPSLLQESILFLTPIKGRPLSNTSMEFKRWYKSKTIRIAIVQALVGIFAAFLSAYPDLQAVGIIAIIKSFLDIALRYDANSSIM